MEQQVEINAGEIAVKFNESATGQVTFKDLGLTNEQLVLDGGFLRLKLDLSSMQSLDFYAVPTIELAYVENCTETHWQCEFNGETILDKMDHHGHSTVLLLNRNVLDTLEQRHENTLIIHAEFPESVHLDAEKSFIQLFK